VPFALVGHVESVWLLQRALLVRVNVDTAFDAFLSHVGPAVSRHPLSLAFRAFVLSEASLLALVRGQALALRTRLKQSTWILPRGLFRNHRFFAFVI